MGKIKIEDNTNIKRKELEILSSFYNEGNRSVCFLVKQIQAIKFPSHFVQDCSPTLANKQENQTKEIQEKDEINDDTNMEELNDYLEPEYEECDDYYYESNDYFSEDYYEEEEDFYFSDTELSFHQGSLWENKWKIACNKKQSHFHDKPFTNNKLRSKKKNKEAKINVDRFISKRKYEFTKLAVLIEFF